MPILLDESEVDGEAEALDAVMDAAEVAKELASFYPQGTTGDLSQGGQAGRVQVYPNPTRNDQRKLVSRGRATARRAWMWDGTETVLPLAWQPDGLRHDGARAYLSKRHCLCCNASGFRGECKECFRKSCPGCRGGTDRTKIIPCFYLSQEKVPFPQKFYGSIPCFLPACQRKGAMGFKTEEEMRLHARGRHRMEYASYQEAEQSRKSIETEELRKRVDELTSQMMRNGEQPPKRQRSEAQKKWASELAARAKARAAAK